MDPVYALVAVVLSLALLGACTAPTGASQNVNFKAEVPLSGVMEYNLH